jgi:hypothetical protein
MKMDEEYMYMRRKQKEYCAMNDKYQTTLDSYMIEDEKDDVFYDLYFGVW